MGTDPGFLKEGGGGLTYVYTQKWGRGPRGPVLGPMLKSLHRGPIGRGPDPRTPPPVSAPVLRVLTLVAEEISEEVVITELQSVAEARKNS